MKSIGDSATPKEIALYKKLRTVGNYVHDSVPISDNEVASLNSMLLGCKLTFDCRIIMR